jgi:hypothetical protein
LWCSKEIFEISFFFGGNDKNQILIFFVDLSRKGIPNKMAEQKKVLNYHKNDLALSNL